MDVSSSRSSQESCFSSVSSTLLSSHSPSSSSLVSSPRLLSSVLSIRSEELPFYKSKIEAQPFLDSLEPVVSTLLSRFDRVNQLTEEIYNLEIQLEEAQDRRRHRRISNSETKETEFGVVKKPQEVGEERATGGSRCRKMGLFYPKVRVSCPSFYPASYNAASLCSFPRVRNSYSESESVPFQPELSSCKSSLGITIPIPAASNCALSDSTIQFPRRRAWHSGSSHSADAAQRASLSSGVSPNGRESLAFINARPGGEYQEQGCIWKGLPLKKKAWISEELETEDDLVFTLEEAQYLNE